MTFTPLELKQEIEKNWTDCEGLVSLAKNPSPRSVDNGLLFTSTVVALCELLGIRDKNDRDKYHSAVQRCRRSVFGTPISGLYNRNEGRDSDLEEHDDYDGVAACSTLIGEFLHWDIYSYGKNNYWYYNNVNPGKFTVNGKFSIRPRRLPHQVAVYELLWERKTNIINELWLFCSLIGSTFGDGTSGKIIAWLRLEALSKGSSFYTKLKKWYLKKMKKKFKGPMGDGMIEVFRIYYPDGHPTVLLAKHYFDRIDND